MRLANVASRAVLITSIGEPLTGVDVASASAGRFGPDLMGIYENWTGFRAWVDSVPSGVSSRVDRSDLGCPSPSPRQVVAIGLNYGEHARESGFATPDSLPPTFTKFVTSLAGPDVTVTLPPGGHTDWEVELVVVIGRTARAVAESAAWDHVAGLAVGQDLSERIAQLRGPAPQFSLGKSFANFAPVGPWLTTPEEVRDRNDLVLGCSIDGETVQNGRTVDLLFPVESLVSRLSHTISLLPGDLIFTGTPAGVGQGRDPQRFLQPGERLDSWIEGIGELHQTFVASPTARSVGTSHPRQES